MRVSNARSVVHPDTSDTGVFTARSQQRITGAKVHGGQYRLTEGATSVHPNLRAGLFLRHLRAGHGARRTNRWASESALAWHFTGRRSSIVAPVPDLRTHPGHPCIAWRGRNGSLTVIGPLESYCWRCLDAHDRQFTELSVDRDDGGFRTRRCAQWWRHRNALTSPSTRAE